MKRTYFFFILAIIPFLSHAQKDKSSKKDPWTSKEIWEPIPINRQLAHDKIDKIQRAADEVDGARDGIVGYKSNAQYGKILTESILKHVDHLEAVIENLPLDHWKKVKQLNFLENAISDIEYELKTGKADPTNYKNIVENYEAIFKKQENGEDIVSLINSNFSRSFYILMPMFKDNKPAVTAVYNHMAKLYPDEMFKKLNEIINEPASEELMAGIAPKKPNLILTYATSTSVERSVVRRCQDPLVKKIVDIADHATTPLKAIIYLDDFNNGTMNIDDINKATATPESYFKSLMLQRQKPNVMTKKLVERESKLAALEYVRTMNELHEAKDPIRFKCIESLSPKEMYYLMVLCSDEIYTSTFVGTFNRMLVKMQPQKGDVFLKELNMDKFRTFIRMCAGYNKLDEFLATIVEADRNTLMATFVHNIDKNVDTDLEDAVDVADAFGSITDPLLLDYLEGEVVKDYERTYQENNKRGLIIYFLLHTLCNTVINPNDTSSELQSQLKIPPITYVPNSKLLDDSGRVQEQVFFYGDDDGKSSFNSFLGIFKQDEWKQVRNDKWITFTSIKGKPCTVYANLPLEEPQDEDAQKALTEFLNKNAIKPSIIVHRGHSYHLPTTLEHVTSSNKIIILGSCGGYHNLSTILGSSEDAHIISSKQTGTMLVNDPLLKAVQQRVLEGRDINWIELWKEVGALMNTKDLQDKFNDYVPPHKNMGALFLKSFKIQMIENSL